MKRYKSIFAFILTICMVVTMLPMQVLASEVLETEDLTSDFASDPVVCEDWESTTTKESEEIEIETEEIPEETLPEQESESEELILMTDDQLVLSNGEFISGNLKYVMNDQGDACVTGCVDTIMDLVIPSSVDGIKVAGIAYEAFKDCATITSLRIPSTLEYINGYAFLNCPKLETVIIDAGNLKYIGHMAFGSCKALTHVSIGEGLVEFDTSVFYGDSGITNITIPSTVKKIGNGAFRETSLASISIPASVTYIGGDAFYGNKDLYSIDVLGNPEYDGNPFNGTAWNDAQGEFPVMQGILLGYNGENPVQITIPSNVKIINGGTFMFEHTLEKVVLPEGITEIGDGAFWYCDALSSINLPSTLQTIGDGAFCGTMLSSVIVPQGITEIADRAFIAIKTLKSIQIPDSVTRIGGAAFADCVSLTSVTLPENLIEIDQEAFDGSGLTSITIPDSVSRIGMYAFHDCNNLSSVILGFGTKNIEKSAFRDCNNLKSVEVPDSVTEIGDMAFGYYEYDAWRYTLVPDFQMSGINGSAAHNYALTNNIPFTGRDPEGLDPEDPEQPEVPEIKPFGPPTVTVANSENGIKVKWNLVQNATKYVIERRVFTRGEYKKLKETDAVTTSYQDVIPTNEMNFAYVSPGSYVTYKVQAYNGMQASGYSQEVSTYYMLKPEIISIENVSSGVKISWTEDIGADQIEIYRKSSDGAYSMVASVNAYNFTSYTDKTVAAEKSYTYKIRGTVFDSEDDENYTSAYSDEKSIVIAKPAAPEVFELSGTSFAYTGSAIKPTVSVFDSNGDKIAASNYSLSYQTAAGNAVTPTAVGSYTVKVTMKGIYSGSKILEYKIVPKKTTIGTPAIAYDGITVKWTKNSSGSGYYIYRSDNGGTYKKVKTITSNTTVSWKDTTAKTNGSKYNYKVMAYKTLSGITYKSAYSSTKTIYFLSRPAISSLSNASVGKLTVKWGKNTKATGYQIQYSTSSSFASGNKTVTVSSNTTTGKSITGLTKGKKYYVRIRTYKTVGSTKYYSAWSAKKYVTIK